jgi:hypothetical protein
LGLNKSQIAPGSTCAVCGHALHDFDSLPSRAYAYLLGIYLGDGMISRVGRCFALRVYMDSRYATVIAEVVDAMRAVMPANLASVYPRQRHNCVVIIFLLQGVAVSLPAAWPRPKAQAQDRTGRLAGGDRRT